MHKIYNSFLNTTKDINQYIEGQWTSKNIPDIRITNIHYDSAYIKQGGLLFLTDSDSWGSKFNDDYRNKIVSAITNGVIAIISTHPPAEYIKDIPFFVVENTYTALGQLAKASRKSFKGQVLCFTGTSDDKWYIKNTLTYLLSKHIQVYSNQHEFCRGPGVRLSLVQTNKKLSYALYELYKSKASSMAYRSQLLKPNIIYIGDISSTQNSKYLKELVFAQAQIINGANDKGIFILNRDLSTFQLLKKQLLETNKAKIITYGEHKSATVCLKHCLYDNGKYKVQISIDKVLFQYILNVSNKQEVFYSLAIICFLYALDLPINLFSDYFEPLNALIRTKHLISESQNDLNKMPLVGNQNTDLVNFFNQRFKNNAYNLSKISDDEKHSIHYLFTHIVNKKAIINTHKECITIIDFGCGDGRLQPLYELISDEFPQQKIKIIAIDFSSEALIAYHKKCMDSGFSVLEKNENTDNIHSQLYQQCDIKVNYPIYKGNVEVYFKTSDIKGILDFQSTDYSIDCIIAAGVMCRILGSHNRSDMLKVFYDTADSLFLSQPDLGDFSSIQKQFSELRKRKKEIEIELSETIISQIEFNLLQLELSEIQAKLKDALADGEIYYKAGRVRDLDKTLPDFKDHQIPYYGASLKDAEKLIKTAGYQFYSTYQGAFGQHSRWIISLASKDFLIDIDN